MSTPKEVSDDVKLWTVYPQLIMITTLIAGIIWKIVHWHQGAAPLTIIVALIFVGQHWILVFPMGQLLKKRIPWIRRKSLESDYFS